MNTVPRILCVSLNPAIDRRLRVPSFQVGAVNRAASVDPAAGGKAAHVAFAAAVLGAEVRWLALLGGAEGEACRAGVAARGVTPVVVEIAGRTRNTLEIIDESTGTITEVLEPGPVIHSAELNRFRTQFEEELHSRPVVVLSGSLSRGLAPNIYAELIVAAKKAGCLALLDASGEPLSASLPAAPDAIKPNRQEAAAILGKPIHSLSEAVEAARTLRRRGPESVLLSLGAEGAIAVREMALVATAPQVHAVSAVGSGDSFLAGWAFATAQDLSLEDRLRLAVACGTANCLAESPGIISREAVKKFSHQVEIRSF